MKEILMELEILKNRMEKDSSFEISFSKILYSITRTIDKGILFNMTDEELIKHIQKIQILES